MITKEFAEYVRINKIIIASFLIASLLITSLIIGAVPQIPIWVLLITIPICLISIILFYLTSYSFGKQKWIICNKHKSNATFSKKKYLKYVYTSLFMLIPAFNWIVIKVIKKIEMKKINEEYITCHEEHLETRSNSIKTKHDSLEKKRIKEFNKDF
ncbi:hypothetical protein C4B25_01960 [Mycoplasma todarodis]|uniref:Uncharacterized protein n=2 Tax=Mycoplasma todarodis TaxID=1937191 RepID=A0A4R0XQU3_9MOLU|nr:hypothetical protein C4B25_01960 [Mycoplasma todarodis]